VAVLHVPALTLPETVVMGTGLAAYGSAYEEVMAPSLRPAKAKGPSGVRQLGTLDLRRGLHVCFRVLLLRSCVACVLPVLRSDFRQYWSAVCCIAVVFGVAVKGRRAASAAIEK
jgi:hypothetical protein